MRRPLRPTPEQLAVLTPLERASFEIADLLARPELTALSAVQNSLVVGALIYACGSRRFNIVGLENVASLDKRDSVLLVSNHRSFFDFFSISAILYWRTKLRRRIFFPTRSTFFYDHPLGPLVNMVMSSMRMFPPVMRDREKRAFNNFMVARCVEELNRDDIGTIVGIHPEGTRNKGADPYSLLKAHPGVGRVALGATRARIIPVFVLGMSQSIGRELKANWLAPEDNPIDMYFGEPIDLTDLRESAHSLSTQVEATDRILDAIRALGERQRRDAALREGRELEPRPPEPVRKRRTRRPARASSDVDAG